MIESRIFVMQPFVLYFIVVIQFTSFILEVILSSYLNHIHSIQTSSIDISSNKFIIRIPIYC